MFLLFVLSLLAVSPVLARKKSKKPTEVLLQADVNIPGMPPIPMAPIPQAPIAEAHQELPPPPTPVSVVPPMEPKKEPAPEKPQEEHLNELKMALDRVASLEQKLVVVESKLSSVEQKLSKVEAQLTTFINELSAPTPEEDEANSSVVTVAEEELPEEDGLTRTL